MTHLPEIALAFLLIWLPVGALIWLWRGRRPTQPMFPPMKRADLLAYAGAVTHGSGR